MSTDNVLDIESLGSPWKTADPFLFCVHHEDAYPAGNDSMGPDASLAGRNLGQDFGAKDGWSMYHGESVPGFPQHPHRGFETVTIVRSGFVDHSDSLGAAARFGSGDVQWLTAGHGIVHAEMFPLLDREGPNPLELFQIWLNLPRTDKMVEPHFAMLWDATIPIHRVEDEAGRLTEVRIVAGRVGDARAPAPPPYSWAARDDTDVAIWSIAMAPNAVWTLPPAQPSSNRSLFVFRGAGVEIGAHAIPNSRAVAVRPDAEVTIRNGSELSELLLLQGRPIDEPVVSYGPFVMNTMGEIKQAMTEYRRTLFGGWPWPSDAPVHPRGAGRFARHANGRLEKVA